MNFDKSAHESDMAAFRKYPAATPGIRVQEVLAVEKPGSHFEKQSTQIIRAVVHGRVKLVKTEYLDDELTLDPDRAVILLGWILQTEDGARREMADNMIEVIESDLLFISLVTRRHYTRHRFAQDYIRPAAAVLWIVLSVEFRPGGPR